jgi:hypothetical protein
VEPTVHIGNEPHVVSVHQQSKTVWIAVGYYMRKRIEVKGRTQLDAVAQWRKKATRYKWNRWRKADELDPAPAPGTTLRSW